MTELSQDEEKIKVGWRSVGIRVLVWPAKSEQNAFPVINNYMYIFCNFDNYRTMLCDPGIDENR